MYAPYDHGSEFAKLDTPKNHRKNTNDTEFTSERNTTDDDHADFGRLEIIVFL